MGETTKNPIRRSTSYWKNCPLLVLCQSVIQLAFVSPEGKREWAGNKNSEPGHVCPGPWKKETRDRVKTLYH